MSRRIRITDACLQCYRNPEPGFVLPGEALDGYRLTWVQEGTLHSLADGKDTLLRPGDLTLHRPGQWHMCYADMDDAPHFVSAVFHSDSTELDLLTGRRLSADDSCTALLCQVLQECENGDPYAGDMVIISLESALIRLLRAREPVSSDTAGITGENRIIHRAQQFISSHVREKLSVPTVAKNTGVSASYLTALFHKHLHLSPGDYIRRVKLQESKRLIREGKLNFTQIAEVLNYSTVHHFSRQFKEKFGITPTEYAKSLE